MHNTFIYRHSDLPPVRPEVKAQIVGIDVHIADLILKSQGNYRELEELAEVLDNCLNTCELNLNSIRIIPDNSPQASPVSMKDLPLEEKKVIYSTSFTNSVLLRLLSEIAKKPIKEVAKEIAENVLEHETPPTNEEVEDFVTNLMPLAKKASKQGGYVFAR